MYKPEWVPLLHHKQCFIIQLGYFWLQETIFSEMNRPGRKHHAPVPKLLRWAVLVILLGHVISSDIWLIMSLFSVRNIPHTLSQYLSLLLCCCCCCCLLLLSKLSLGSHNNQVVVQPDTNEVRKYCSGSRLQEGTINWPTCQHFSQLF